MIAQSIEGSKAGYLAFPAPSKSNTGILSHMEDEYGNCKASFVPARRFSLSHEIAEAKICRTLHRPSVASQVFSSAKDLFDMRFFANPCPQSGQPICQFLQRMPLRKETNTALFSPAC
jgi:hypothetical protein